MAKFKIVVVDDSGPMREVIIKIIKAAGYCDSEFIKASNGREAIDIIASSWVDLLVTDYNMPDMNGLDLLLEIKKDEVLSTIPVLVITTEKRPLFIQKFIEAGASGYLQKPFKPEEIREKLVEILGENKDELSMEKSDDDLDF